MGPAAGPTACWTSLFFQVGSGLIFQPAMSSAAGPMVCWTSLFFQIGERIVIQSTMGPAARPIACWTSLFFPIGSGVIYNFSSSSTLWVQQLDQRLAGQACFPSWTTGLLDKLVLPSRGADQSYSPLWVQQLDQWPAGQACSSHLGTV